MPLRFFCNNCRQLLKIGTAQAGTLIVCPKCKQNVTVPQKTNTQAEALYSHIKQRKAEAAAELAQSKSSLLFRSSRAASGKNAYYENLQLYLKDAVRTTETPEKNSETHSGDQLDQWVNEFWETNIWEPEPEPVRKKQDVYAPPVAGWQTQQNSAPQSNVQTLESELDELDSAAVIARQQLSIRSLKILLGIVFLLGLAVGFFGHILLVKENRIFTPQAAQLQGENVLFGTIQYVNPNGDQLPDFDAVAIFIPANAKPLIPVNGKWLRPDENFNPDAVQSLEELGGKCFRANAMGEFEFAYKPGQKYLVVFISANGLRNEAVPPDILSKLRKFFANPDELLEGYKYFVKEFSWKEGRYLLWQDL